MPRPPITPELRQKIIEDFIQGTATGQFETKKAAIAHFQTKYKLSESSLQKMLVGVKAVQSRPVVLDAQAAAPILSLLKYRAQKTTEAAPDDGMETLKVVDFDLMVLGGIAVLQQGVTVKNVKSAESAAKAIIKLMEAYDRRNPRTMRDLVYYVLNYPGFSVEGFLAELKAVIKEIA